MADDNANVPHDLLVLPAVLVRPGDPTPDVPGMGGEVIRLPVTIRYTNQGSSRRGKKPT